MTDVSRVQLRRALVMVHDLVATGIAWIFAFYLRYDFAPPESVKGMLLWSTPAAMAVFGACYQWSQMYGGIWRYASVPDLVRIGRAVGMGTVLVVALLFLTVRAGDLPRGVMVILPLLLMTFLSGPRLVNRLVKMRHEFLPRGDDSGRRRILLVGAGDASELLLRDAMRTDARFTVVGLVDDDLKKQGLRIHGVPVHGPIATLARTIDHLTAIQRRPDELVIAIPSASREQMRRIVDCCERSGLPFRATPALDDIVTGRVQIGELREVTIEDLLSRASVRLDESAVRSMITGKTVLVTGAGGSIGSELCRQIARFGPEKLVLFELTEFNLYEIDRELGRIFPGVARAAVLGDVRDDVRVRSVLAEHQPDTVLHAAAYKHVPLVEQNATEGVLNNLLGTRTIARACAKHGVSRFVLVSTDKAVNPVNVMGATKRLAEIYCQHLQDQTRGGTQFVTVRFGNVLGSIGSVVPLFREQIRKGGPVTVTHPDMQRYFMTIPEASQLILQAACLGRGGEVFVLDMGRPVRILDLANDMIRLSGKEPGKDIEVVFTGLRPGEKLFEELGYDSEEVISSAHEKIFLSRQMPPVNPVFERRVDRLLDHCRAQETGAAVSLLEELVPEYRPAENGVARGESRPRSIRSASAVV